MASVGEVVCGGDLVAGNTREFGKGVLSSVYRPLLFTYLNRECFDIDIHVDKHIKICFP